MFLDEKTMLEIWLNPGINLTIFLGTGPRRLCVVVDSLISAAKVCDCVISAWCWQDVCDRVVELRLRQNVLCQPLILFSRCLA